MLLQFLINFSLTNIAKTLRAATYDASAAFPVAEASYVAALSVFAIISIVSRLSLPLCYGFDDGFGAFFDRFGGLLLRFYRLLGSKFAIRQLFYGVTVISTRFPSGSKTQAS